MRLSDRQYNILTRLGLFTLILVVFLFDRIPEHLRWVLFVVAGAGALVGFFPLVTSKPFQTDNERLNSEVHDQLNGIAAFTSAAANVTSETVTTPVTGYRIHHFHADPVGITAFELYRQRRAREVGSLNLGHDARYFAEIIESRFANDAIKMYMQSMQLEKEKAERERAERVAEMHMVLEKLIGIPQAFSVELTTSNRIIVKCERPKEARNILQTAAEIVSERAADSMHGRKVMVN